MKPFISQLNKIILNVLRQERDNRPRTGVIHAIDGPTVDVRVNSGANLLRNVPTIGDPSVLYVGQTVALTWMAKEGTPGGAPAVMAGGGSDGTNVGSSSAPPDEITITDDYGFTAVKEGGVGLEHLNFSPVLAGNEDKDSLLDYGWQITEEGVLYTNGMYIHPGGQIGIGIAPDIVKIDSTHEYYRIWAGANDPEDAHFVVDKYGNTYVRDYIEATHLDLELMRIQFQSIDWAQFAIFDAFGDETKRADPEPGTYPARVLHGKVDNGDDDTANRVFTFTSKTYSNIVNVESGISESSTSEYMQDNDADWVADRWKDNYQLLDDVNTVFYIEYNTSTRIYISGGGASGDGNWIEEYWSLDYFPQDSYPYWPNWDVTTGSTPVVGDYIIRALLDTEAGTDLLGAIVDVTTTGRDYMFRVSLKNDASGDGAIVHNLLICTDPSIYQA
jgi:hypothetical protein